MVTVAFTAALVIAVRDEDVDPDVVRRAGRVPTDRDAAPAEPVGGVALQARVGRRAGGRIGRLFERAGGRRVAGPLASACGLAKRVNRVGDAMPVPVGGHGSGSPFPICSRDAGSLGGRPSRSSHGSPAVVEHRAGTLAAQGGAEAVGYGHGIEFRRIDGHESSVAVARSAWRRAEVSCPRDVIPSLGNIR